MFLCAYMSRFTLLMKRRRFIGRVTLSIPSGLHFHSWFVFYFVFCFCAPSLTFDAAIAFSHRKYYESAGNISRTITLVTTAADLTPIALCNTYFLTSPSIYLRIFLLFDSLVVHFTYKKIEKKFLHSFTVSACPPLFLPHYRLQYKFRLKYLLI